MPGGEDGRNGYARILAEAIARELGPKGVDVAYVMIDAVIDLEQGATAGQEGSWGRGRGAVEPSHETSPGRGRRKLIFLPI